MYLMNRLEFKDLFKIVIELVEFCTAVLEKQFIKMLDWGKLISPWVSTLLGFYLLKNMKILSIYRDPSPFILAVASTGLSWHFLNIISIIWAAELVKIGPSDIFFNVHLFVILLHLLVEVCLLIWYYLVQFLLNYVDTSNHFLNFWNFDINLFDVVWNRCSLR